MEVNENKIILLDGAMGTMLQRSGLPLGVQPELLNITDKELIQSIHRAYVEAGSEIISSNTFGANRHKLEGCGYELEEIVSAALGNAKAACAGYDAKVALDIGPIGELLEPSGTLKFEEAYDIFRELVVAGVKAGADLILFETMTDLYEVKAAVLAAKEHSDLPVFVTMTFEENQRTFTGCSIEAMAVTLQGLGVDAIGMNCSLGPKEILPLMQELGTYTHLPLFAKPNAGLPDPETGQYFVFSEEFSLMMLEYAKAGVQYLGGCCGTDPEFIASMKKTLAGVALGKREYHPMTKLATPTQVVRVDTVRVIGERINPTGKKRFAQALQNREISYILGQAIEQVEAGADILDVNVGVPQMDESSLMVEVVKAIQSVVSVPLQIDSSSAAALEAGLRVYNGKAILNSVNGEDKNLATLLPIAKKYGAAVVCLTMDSGGIPQNAQERMDIARKIIQKALEIGIPQEDLLVDCLALTVSAQQKDCFETLGAMAQLRDEFGVQLVLGVSNISFGLPNRELVNHSFLTLAMANGLTLPILNPNIPSMMDAVGAYRVLSGYDVDSEAFIARHGGKETAVPVVQAKTGGQMSLEEAVLKGLGEEVDSQVRALLEHCEPMTIVNEKLIPTLDIVGVKFEAGELFLPQLIRSATACCCGFDLIKAELAQRNQGGIGKGKIILATVKGDIHDIGKNIVKVILENYGYEILDLGRDVPAETVVQRAIEEDVSLVGLSALMTTTVESMRETIAQIRASGHSCQVMVGGAVLTEEYAMKIGADFYAKDAQKSVAIAKEVLG